MALEGLVEAAAHIFFNGVAEWLTSPDKSKNQRTPAFPPISAKRFADDRFIDRAFKNSASQSYGASDVQGAMKSFILRERSASSDAITPQSVNAAREPVDTPGAVPPLPTFW